MTEQSKRLVAYGFVKKGVDKNSPTFQVGKYIVKIEGKTPQDKLKFIKEKKAEYDKLGLGGEFENAIEGIAAHEWAEYAKNQMVMTDYPESLTRHYLGMESWHQSIEEHYYLCLNLLSDFGFPIIDKVTDVFTASEHSSFYGAAAQRLGLSQDKVAQYLATIGKMVKDLFQLVRELRWIDERLEIYKGAVGERGKDGKFTKQPEKGSELTLKGMWIDLVDGVVGGQRTGSNLFVMAQQLQFTALPDLFFSIHPQDVNEVEKTVEEQAKEFNEPLRNLLKRKLTQYIAWKKSTYDEIKARRKFTLDYLRQHYQVIRMYMNWVKPYIKHIERLSGQQDLLNNPRLITAFESSLVEIEVIARQKPAGAKSYACIMLTLEYHTKPSMQYPGDSGYHRGPIHVGSTRITWRSYDWDEKTIENYIKLKRQEDMELLASIDKSLISAMEAMGTDLQNYLEEAEGIKKEEKKEEKQPLALMEPFTAVGKGMYEMFGAFMPKIQKKKSGGGGGGAAGPAMALCFLHYNIFKKARGMLSW